MHSRKKCKKSLQFVPPIFIFPSIFNFYPFEFSPDFIFPATKPATLKFFSHKIQIFPILIFPTKFNCSNFHFPLNFQFFPSVPDFFPPIFNFVPWTGFEPETSHIPLLKVRVRMPVAARTFFMSENLLIFPTVYCASNQAKSLSPHPV